MPRFEHLRRALEPLHLSRLLASHAETMFVRFPDLWRRWRERRMNAWVQRARAAWPRTFALSIGPCPLCSTNWWYKHEVCPVAQHFSCDDPGAADIDRLASEGRWLELVASTQPFQNVDLYECTAIRCPVDDRVAVVLTLSPAAFESSGRVIRTYYLSREHAEALTGALPAAHWRRVTAT